MSSKKGLLQTCDRCGASCFREYIGKGEADGGYTTWDKFRPSPDGWNIHSETGTLCPACEAEYQDMLKRFKEKVKTDAD